MGDYHQTIFEQKKKTTDIMFLDSQGRLKIMQRSVSHVYGRLVKLCEEKR